MQINLNELRSYTAKELPPTVVLAYAGSPLLKLVPPLVPAKGSIPFSSFKYASTAELIKLAGCHVTVRGTPVWSIVVAPL